MLGVMDKHLRETIDELKQRLPEYATQFDEILGNLENGASQMGRKGGLARAKKLSKKRRKEIASKAAKARWAK
jgi:hypothetical protein